MVNMCLRLLQDGSYKNIKVYAKKVFEQYYGPFGLNEQDIEKVFPTTKGLTRGIGKACQNTLQQAMGSHLTKVRYSSKVDESLLNVIIEDMKKYKKRHKNVHAGDLYEHSIWVALTIKKWFEDKDSWCEGLEEKDKELAIVAGLLHDIGKAGDLVYLYDSKRHHPQKGFEYLSGKATYKFTGKDQFDFEHFFKTLNVSDENKKTIAVIAGAHYFFGELLENTSIDKHNMQVFIGKIDSLAKAVNLINEHEHASEKLIKLCILITAADAKGMQPFAAVFPGKTVPDNLSVFGYTIDLADQDLVKSDKDTGVFYYDIFDYENRGKNTRAAVVDYLKTIR